jgi:hypothetical protein
LGSSPATWLSIDVGPELRKRGFTKNGSTFHRRTPESWEILNFQKSQWGSRLETSFTINLGVALDRLTVVRGGDPSRKPPENWCHWRSRIGRLLEDQEDHWWTLDLETDLPELTAEIVPLLVDRALPLLEACSTEAGFLATAKTNGGPGNLWIPKAQVLETLETGDDRPSE